ncbi:MAG: flagellin lysine-N-methylase, partial [Clostridium sp.]
NLSESINYLINTYRIIKGYAIGVALSLDKQVDEEIMIRVIQGFSKEKEHNKVLDGVIGN